MPSGYKRQHLRIDQFAELKPYKRPKRSVPARDRGHETEQHAEALKKELASAWAASNDLLEARDADVAGSAGRYLDFETLPNASLPDLTWSNKGIRLASATRTPNGEVGGTLFVPDDAQAFLTEKLDEYRVKRGKRGRPSHAPRFAAIEHFRAARLESLWVDSRSMPEADLDSWWECWCWPDRVGHLEAKATAANVLIGEGRLRFAEREVIFLHTDRATIARIVASTDAVAELRLGRDDAYFFTNDKARADQHGWIAEAVSRIELAENRDAVAVCLLDTGINRAHPLLAPLIAAEDLHSLNPDWGVSDHHGHGSEMSGLALYGDLTTCFASASSISIPYVGEGVKLLAPPGFDPTQPQSYGLATRQAILRPEIAKPLRERVFCMAVTQQEVFGPKPTSWSASLDATAFGGDDLKDLRRRLLCVSAGNLPDGLRHDDLEGWDSYEIEDPAHAWNVMTVGGYTQKGPITDQGFTHWPCAVELGTLSPYSRVSAAWARGVSPIKPELVLEAGNKGVDSADQSMVSGIDSLSLLTTSRDPLGQPLTLSWATSAATAQLCGMAATVLADNSELWPETVRALLVHSARWTPPMEAQLLGTNQKSMRLQMLRRFGYGVPDLARTLRSASNSLALVSQQEIQPFIREKGKSTRLNHAHVYALPWPAQTLLDLGEHQVRLRVTLSYFVEPNPSADAPLSPARYRSSGLRFDLRRTGETQPEFEARINQLAAIADDDGTDGGPAADPSRILGEKSISAGSLHVDEWRCNAAELADRASIAIFPVGGWWKNSGDRGRNNGSVRYALVITIDAGDVEQDLWIETAIAAGVEIQVEQEVSIDDL
jgi:hypothetical protein